MKYFLSTHGDEIRGPYETAELRRFVANGAVPKNSQVCAEGATEWQSLADLLGLSSKSRTTQLVPPKPGLLAPAPQPKVIPKPIYHVCNEDGAVIGPYDLEKIRRLIHGGVILPSSRICRVGQKEWMPLMSLISPVPHVSGDFS